jgi:transposase
MRVSGKRSLEITPCMFESQLTPPVSNGLICAAGVEAGKRLPRRPAADRHPSGAPDAVGERDRRRPRGINPDSRKSRRQTVSSNWQGRESAMSAANDVQGVIVGIDVSKNSAEACSMPGARRWKFQEPAEMVHALLELRPSLVVVEASGGYERPWVGALSDASIAVAVVNPKRIRDFARAMGHLAKTDTIDASVIAEYGKVAQPRPLEKMPAKQVELQELVNRRRQLLGMRTMEQNRKHSAASPATRRSIEKILKAFNRELDHLEKAIAELLESDDDWRDRVRLLRDVPGVGEVTGATLVAEVPELGRLNRQ